jgi:hypothetical protein
VALSPRNIRQIPIPTDDDNRPITYDLKNFSRSWKKLMMTNNRSGLKIKYQQTSYFSNGL